ncbi:jerky protein homolog-like [Anastrepha obliqua]|uniref:jerky protein homolog-like n=1 Tax=Anastrepha obliqua TaxID=95512 RepID=UPI00240A4442|nr:jerky protein homolog-like [Anastrepha obliqua]
MSAKRKRIVVSMDTRLKVLRRIDNGESVAKICAEFSVGKSTVNDWRRDRRSSEEFSSKMESDRNLGSRCTRKKPIYEVVDEALWIWFLQERRRGTPIGGPILKEKALAIHQKINVGGDFVASDGWLNRWKKRHGIHFAQASGEKMSADTSGATEFKTKFGEMIKTEELSPEQVYNIDETGLNIKMLPETTFLGSHEQSASGFKKNKELITVAFNMKVLFLLTLCIAMLFGVMGQSCPSNFKWDSGNKLCLAERPIHGECPAGSLYNLNYNKCVYAARG